MAEGGLVADCVTICAELLRVKDWRGAECCHDLFAWDEDAPAQRYQPPDGSAVPGHRERFTSLNGTHDRSRIIT
jgi:hypothetical protein